MHCTLGAYFGGIKVGVISLLYVNFQVLGLYVCHEAFKMLSTVYSFTVVKEYNVGQDDL